MYTSLNSECIAQSTLSIGDTTHLYPTPIDSLPLPTKPQHLSLLHNIQTPLQSMLTIPLLRTKLPRQTLEGSTPTDR